MIWRDATDVAGDEPAAEQRLHAERFEHAGGDGNARHLLGLAVARHGRDAGRPEPDALEHAVLFRVRDKHRRRRGSPPRSSGNSAPGASCQIATTSSASGYASGSSSTLLTTANVAVAAPLPIASVATATSVIAGLRSSERSA